MNKSDSLESEIDALRAKIERAISELEDTDEQLVMLRHKATRPMVLVGSVELQAVVEDAKGQLDELTGRVDNLVTVQVAYKQRLDAYDRRISTLHERLVGVVEQLNTLEAWVGRLHEDFHSHTGDR